MLFAPYKRCHCTALIANADNIVLISSRSLYRCDVESHGAVGLASTLDMKRSTAVMARYAGAAPLMTDSANFLVFGSRNGRDPFAWLERLRVAKLDLGSEDRAGHMDPIVVGGLLQRFPGNDRSSELLLSFSIELGCFHGLFFLLSLALTLFLGLLLVRDLRRLYKIMLRVFHWAQNTFVVLESNISVSPTYCFLLQTLTKEFCGFLSLVHISQIHLPVCRLSITP